jgi:hypothetical protein
MDGQYRNVVGRNYRATICHFSDVTVYIRIIISNEWLYDVRVFACEDIKTVFVTDVLSMSNTSELAYGFPDGDEKYMDVLRDMYGSGWTVRRYTGKELKAVVARTNWKRLARVFDELFMDDVSVPSTLAEHVPV